MAIGTGAEAGEGKARAPLDKQVALQAAEWYLCLQSGEASAADRAACERWRAESAEHERAWLRAQKLGEKIGVVPASVAVPTLGRRERREGAARRKAVKMLAALIVAVPGGWLWWQHGAMPAWRADYRTAVGERRELRLADGSRLFLNTATSVDVAFDDARRALRLYAGEIQVHTAPDPWPGTQRHGPRPFVVMTGQGELRPLGTRFNVRLDGDRGESVLAVFEGRVEIRPTAAPAAARIVEAGQQARFDATQVMTPGIVTVGTAGWREGILYADRMRLADFCAELARYRRMWLRCDPVVGELRVSGAFQLDNLDAVLASLPDALPVSVIYRSRYWVTIGPAGAAT